MELNFRIQKVHALFRVFVASVLWLTISVVSNAQETNVNEAELKQMIRDLGSETYAVRQLASEQLWQLGAAAKPALKLASQESNTEVAKRAKQILEVFEMGIDAQTSPEVAQLVLRFNNSGKQVRGDILRSLVRDDRFELVFQLLEQIDKSQQQQIFKEILNLDDTLIRLARSDRWKDFVFLFSHPVTFEHDRTVAVFYHLANNSLDKLLQDLKTEILEKETDGKKLTSKELYSFVAVLRLTGRYKEAEEFALKNSDPTKKFSLLHLIWMEQGQWDKIAKVMVDKDAPVRPEDGKLVATESQRALVYHFNGDKENFQKVIDGLNKKRDEFESNEDKDGVENIRKVLIQIGMATLDWNLTESNLDLEDKKTTFSIYDFTRRMDQAFEVIELGTNLDERNLWFNRRLRTIKSLQAKIKRLKDQNADTEESETELQTTWTMCFEIAEKLQQLGFDNESLLHYSNLFSAMGKDENYTRRSGVVKGLMKLERYDDVWTLLERGFSGQEFNSLLYTLFEKKYAQARYWQTKLAKHYRNPLKRLRAISGMLNSPLGSLPGLDIEQELARLRVDETANRSGTIDYQTHLIYLYHGKHDMSERYRQMAGELGYTTVRKSIAQEAFDNNDLDSAIKYFDDTWKQRTAPVEALYSSEAFKMKGNARNAMLRKCLAYAFWRDSYRNTSTVNLLEEQQKIGWVEGFIRIDVCSPYGLKISNERYRLSLANAQADIMPDQSVINRRISLFNSCARESSSFPSTLAFNAIQSNLAASRVAIADGKFDEALEFLLEVNSFAPGDPSTGEKLIAELDLAGASEQADRLFEAIAEPYFAMIAKYPDSPLYRNDYSWICACANRRTEHMLRHIEIAASKRANYSNYVDTLAEVNFLLGNKEKAIELARRCISLDPLKLHYKQQLERFGGKQTN